MGIPHGITIRGYTGAETVEVVTARNEAGDIPAWDTYPAKSEYFMPLTVKKKRAFAPDTQILRQGLCAGYDAYRSAAVRF